ncbi:MAG: hypothetical protein GXO60_06675 [Epsilonproteobacteria bacterium]|nr:hypothetical protein [Campylobacterota bacterium]
MYIYSFSNYTDIPTDNLSDKKKLLIKRFNRTDNFINLALLGAQRCMKDIKINKDSSIYISSKNGNMNSTIKVLEAIFLENKLPMPFNFLNSVNASTLFFIAQNFNIEGKTIFINNFESAIVQAYIDVLNNKTTLIGNVDEAISDCELRQKRFKSKDIKEYSRWLLISSNSLTEKPIAKISDIKLTTDNKSPNDITNLFDFLESSSSSFNFIGKNLSLNITKL